MWGNVPAILDGAGFQISTIVVCVSCLFYTFIHSKPEKVQNKLFVIIFCNILITAVCNFMSALSKPYLDTSKAMRTVRVTAQYIYFVFHSFLAPLYCFYIALITGANYVLKKKHHLFYEIPVILTVLLVIINPFTHWVYYFTGNGDFHRNWGENIIYIVSILYYIFAVVMLLFFWDAISVKTRRVMIYFFTLVGVGTFVQFLFVPMHTELFAEAIAMTAVMIIIENEEGRKDSRTKIYNHAALAYDIQKFMRVRRSFFIICIKMQNPMSLMQLVGPANIERLTEQTAEYIASIVPRYSIYYIGTGTFVVVNENSDRNYNIELAKKIKERFSHSWRFQDRDTTFNATVFCAEIPTDLKTYKDIMMLINGPVPMDKAHIDDVYYGNSLNYVLRRSQVEDAIINGLSSKSFEVYYQPIYNLSDLSICSGEALLRLHDAEIGDIYPDEFLPIAERSGMIFDLGDFVLDEVCKFLNSGIPTEMGIETLNVNLSVIQCIQSNYAERIIDLVSKYDISPSRIAFEITESAATTDFNALRAFVEKLREKGFKFTVDDYGVGYSNVHSILSLDVDIIKIDRTILWEAEQSETGRIIMESSVAMIKKMGKQILITGVETKPQIDLAHEFGVDYLQGYYFSNPISQNEFIGILKATQIARFEEQKALAASEAMSNFLANMSHEIRTPINAVLGMDEMILRESDDDRIIEYAKTIEGAGRTLLSIINDILDFSKIEKGNVEIVESNYELSSLLSDVINMVWLRAEKKGLKLVTEVEPTTPEKLYGDEVRIRQIIINLLNNAVKYTDKGSVTLKVGYEKTDKENINLKVSVSDTGIGIKEEDLGKLFDKFKRLDLDKNKTIEGSGLGLPITSQLIKLMNGGINVESTYGEGSTFSVSIPQRVLTDEKIGRFNSRRAVSKMEKAKNETWYTAPDAKLLIVDDTSMNLMVVRELLKRTKVQIDEAGSGMECIKKATERKYDIILLDYRMPEMDGIEVLNRLKEMDDNKNKETPIIALTANAISGARERFLNEGFDDYITKPVDGEKLEKLIMAYLPDDKIRPHEVEVGDDKTGGLDEDAASRDSNSFDVSSDGMKEAKDVMSGETSDAYDKKYGDLDVESGIELCGSKETYDEVLSSFREGIKEKVSVIRNALEEDDIKRYTVEVHAIKSSARLIGANNLSELARSLEEAGDAGNINLINEKTDELLDLYESYGYSDNEADEGSNAVQEEEADASKPELSEEMWEDALSTMKEFAKSMDYDNSMGVLKSMNGYRLSDKIKEKKRIIESHIRKLDWDKFVEAIDNILGKKG